MSMYLLPLTAADASDATVVGQKAAVLSGLLAAGAPIPGGICVSTRAFDMAVAPLREDIAAVLKHHDLLSPTAAEEAAAAIHVLFASLAVPPSIASELNDALPALFATGPSVSVRSSATAEDRPGTSFAGQYDTVLGLRTAASVLEAVVTCWKSFYSPHALLARATAGAASGNEAMAVLIQRMVDADCAGVCMTVDPAHGRRDRMIIDASWGLGAGTVDGTVATDTVWVRRAEPQSYEDRRIVEKTAQIQLNPDGGVYRTPVPEDQRRAACLTHEALCRVTEWSLTAEMLLGCPQDVEWAIDSNQFWILQSRPVTGIPEAWLTTWNFPVTWSDDEDRHRGWSLDGGSRRSVSRPLEHDVLAMWWASFADTAHFRGSPRYGRIAEINGRGYITERETDYKECDQRVREAAQLDQLHALRAQSQTLWDAWSAPIIAATRRMSAFDSASVGHGAIADHLEDAFGLMRRHWFAHWNMWAWEGDQNPFHVSFLAITGMPKDQAEAAMADLIDGEDTVLTRLIDGLCDLARTASQEPAVASMLEHPMQTTMEQLATLPEAAAFREQLVDFLTIYGDRMGIGFGSEASIGQPTWREDPTDVFRLMAPYLGAGLESPRDARARARRARDARVDEICAACDDEDKITEFRRCLAVARREATVLEDHNHYIDQMSYGQLRAAILMAGRVLVDRGVIPTVEDVFWLRREEIGTALRAESPASASDTLAARKDTHIEQTRLDPPPVLGTPPHKITTRKEYSDEVTTGTADGGEVVKGHAASRGRRRGRARVISTATIVPMVSPGDILVAENAGPSWTPIFPILGGIVLDQGVVTQHAGTTAREYGVPAVFRTNNATRRIKEGDWIIVDGDTGMVEVDETRTV